MPLDPDRTAAIVDLGSASASAMVVRVGQRGRIDVVARAKAALRLAAALDADDCLPETAVVRILAAMRTFADLAAAHDVVSIRAVATEALRRARNRDAICAIVRDETGVDLEVIDGQREARLVFGGMRLEVRRGALFGLDLGGGSTELVWGVGPTPERTLSLPFGAIETTRRLELHDRAMRPGELDRARSQLDAWLLPKVAQFAADLDLRGLSHAGRVVGTSGSVQRIGRIVAAMQGQTQRTLAQVPISAAALTAVVEQLASCDIEHRRQVPGMDVERVDSLLGGALLLECLGRCLAIPHWRIGLSGLRLGLCAVALGLSPDWRTEGSEPICS